MVITLLKCLSIFSCSIYTLKKISSNTIELNLQEIILKVIFLTFFTIIYKTLFSPYYLVFSFILFVIFELFSFSNTKLIFTFSCISYCINQIIYSFQSVVICFLFSLFWKNFSFYPELMVVIISSILQPIIIINFFRIPRFKKGMPFLLTSKTANMCFYISFIVLLCLFIITNLQPNQHSYVFLFHFIIIAMFIPLIIWWRHKIKESYLAYLREFELTQLHQQINDLSTDNERLSRIVHKDNKLVSAMASSVLTLLEKAPEYDRKEFLAQCDSLHKELSELSLHRQELLVSTTSEVSPLGNSHKLVESVLSYEVKNARHSGICTKYNIDSNFMAAIETYLTDEELAHILADMIQNAIIAMKATTQQSLLINLHMINGNPTISVMDSGAEFSPEVLQNLGLAPCSTHLNEGGSGIGLMDIWQLKIKSKASMVIKELPQPGDYTKQLSIIFDGKNKYVVFTNRKQELTKMINRFDMYIESV